MSFMNNKEKANDLIEQALQIIETVDDNNKINQLLCVAKAQAKIGDEAGAKKILEKVKKIKSPKIHYHSYVNMAKVLLEIGDKKSAHETLKNAVEIFSKNETSITIDVVQLAKSQVEIGDKKGARETLKNAVEIFSKNETSSTIDVVRLAKSQVEIGDEEGSENTLYNAFLKIQEINDDSDRFLRLESILNNLNGYEENLELNFNTLEIARNIINQEMQIAQQIDNRAIWKRLYSVALVQAKIGENEAVKNTLRSAFLKIQEIDNDTFRIFQLNEIISRLEGNKIKNDFSLGVKCLELNFKISEIASDTINQEIHRAHQIDIPAIRSSGLSELAVLQAKIGLVESARISISNIKSFVNEETGSTCDGILTDITKAQAEIGDITEALQTFQKIHDDVYKKFSLLAIGRAQAKAGEFNKAIKTVQQITDEEDKNWILRDVAEAQAKAGEFDKAIKTAQQITNEEDKNRILRYVADRQIEAGEFDKAIKTVQQITNEEDKNRILSDVADGQIEADEFDKAIKTVQQITDEEYKSWALGDVAEAQAKAGNFDEAIKTVQKITDEETKSYSFASIAEEQAKTGYFKDAFKILTDITYKDAKVRPMVIIAISLMKLPYFSVELNYPNSVPVGTSFGNNYIISANDVVNISTRLSSDYEIINKPDTTISIDGEHTIELEIIPKKTGELTISPLRISCNDEVESPEITITVTEELKIETKVDYPETIQEQSSFDIKFTVANNSEFTTAENVTIDFTDAKHEFSGDNYTIDIPRIPPKKERTVKTSLIPKFLGDIAFNVKTLADDDTISNETIPIEIIEKSSTPAKSTKKPAEKAQLKTTKETPIEITEVTIKRGYTHRGRFIRFKTKVENNSKSPLRDVKLILSLPSTLRCDSLNSPESTIGDIESGETLACEFLLKPTACTTANVKGYVVYKDISGEIQTLSMKGKEVETCRPNLEHLPLTFAEVTETISSKQLYKDSEHITLEGINSADTTPLLIKTAEWMNMHHVEDNGHDNQLIFVGRQKVEQTMVIARAAVQGDVVKIRCYVEREDLVAGFLAEFMETLEEHVASTGKPSKDTIYRLQDIFDNIDDALSFDPSKDTIFTHLNKAHEVCRKVDMAVSKEIAEFVDHIQMVKEHKDKLDDADVVKLKQSIDSWNEVVRGKGA